MRLHYHTAIRRTVTRQLAQGLAGLRRGPEGLPSRWLWEETARWAFAGVRLAKNA